MKFLCVDLGNVIIEVNFDNFVKTVSEFIDVSIEDVWNFLYTTKLHDLGLTTISNELKSQFNVDSKFILSKLVRSWNQTIKPNEKMNQFLIDAYSSGYEIALLSNIGVEHASLIRDFISPNLFDKCIKFFSCEVGARKPQYLYYKTFLDLHPHFRGCLYLDDRQENLDTGKLFDFKTKLFCLDNKTVSIEEKIKELKQILKI